MKIKLIDNENWEKTAVINKSIIRVGSSESCNVVLTDPGIMPVHFQLMPVPDDPEHVRVQSISGITQILRDNQKLVLKPPESQKLISGDQVLVGGYRLEIQMSSEIVYCAETRHISVQLHLSGEKLIPHIPIVGHLELKNKDDQNSIQFDIKFENLPDDCIVSEPAPHLYPNGTGMISFTIYHKGQYPEPGPHKIFVRIGSSDQFPEDMVTFQPEIYVMPYTENIIKLEDDRPNLAAEILAEKTEEKTFAVKPAPPLRPSENQSSPALPLKKKPAPVIKTNSLSDLDSVQENPSLPDSETNSEKQVPVSEKPEEQPTAAGKPVLSVPQPESVLPESIPIQPEPVTIQAKPEPAIVQAEPASADSVQKEPEKVDLPKKPDLIPDLTPEEKTNENTVAPPPPAETEKRVSAAAEQQDSKGAVKASEPSEIHESEIHEKEEDAQSDLQKNHIPVISIYSRAGLLLDDEPDKEAEQPDPDQQKPEKQKIRIVHNNHNAEWDE